MVTRPLSSWSGKLLSICGVFFATFALLHLLPGPPIALYESWPSDPHQRARLIAQYGFERPLPAQFFIWSQRIVTGQWGTSRFSARPVFHDAWQATALTLVLLLWTVLAGSVGVGLLAIWRRLFPRTPPHPLRGLPLALFVCPKFLMALLLRELLVWQLGWSAFAVLPLFDTHYLFNPFYMLLPASVLALTPLLVWYASGPQGALPHVAGQRRPWSRRWQQFCRDFRPLLGGFFLEMLLIDHVFSISGLGDFGLTALKRRDLPAFQGFILCTAVLYGGLFFVLERAEHWLSLAAAPRARAIPLGATPRRRWHYEGLGSVLLLLVLTVSASWLVPYDPTEIHTGDQFRAPGHRYLLGTDFLGRDVLSRTVQGFRSSIPRVASVAMLAWACYALLRRIVCAVPGGRGLWYGGAALLRGIPAFALFFMVLLIVESHAWALEIALTLACIAFVWEQEADRGAPLGWAAQLAQLGSYALMLEVTFFFLNLGTEPLVPLWGSDIRFGMTHGYGNHNLWMLLAPALAVAWSNYTWQQLGSASLLIRSPSVSAFYRLVARWRGRMMSSKPTMNMSTLITWGMRKGPR